VEVDTWAGLRHDKLSVEAAFQSLADAREVGTFLSARSLDFLATPAPSESADARRAFVEQYKSTPPSQQV
jgi:hypothetical protein